MQQNLSDDVQTVLCPSTSCRKNMKKESTSWVCSCGTIRNIDQLNSLLASLVRRTFETANIDQDCSEDNAKIAIKKYLDILSDMSSIVRHPWKGLVMPMQLFWKSLRVVNGNKSTL